MTKISFGEVERGIVLIHTQSNPSCPQPNLRCLSTQIIPHHNSSLPIYNAYTVEPLQRGLCIYSGYTLGPKDRRLRDLSYSGAKRIYTLVRERTVPNTYIITKPSQLEPLFYFAQTRNLYMYKTRITESNIGWVIEVPPGTMETRLLLEYANSLERIATIRV